MAYQALYRKWRPQRFDEMVGQQHVTQTLKNAIQKRHFTHAYLFSGPRGTGKTSAAKILAKAINCLHPEDGEPCNQCPPCGSITSGANLDVVEIDAASNRGVDEVREIREKVRFAPTDVAYKVYIVDEVHMMTNEAFNALLKTLEEPPPHAVFVLATTEPHKVPDTIISRCQRFDFHRVSNHEVVSRLKTVCEHLKIDADEEGLYLIARYAAGGMRDALSLLDQVLAFTGNRLVSEDVLQVVGTVRQTVLSEIARAIQNGDVAALIDQLDQLLREGKSPEQLLSELISYFRDVMVYRMAPHMADIQRRVQTDPGFESIAESFSEQLGFQLFDLFNRGKQELKWADQPAAVLEMTLIKAGRLQETEQTLFGSPALEQLIKRIDDLEKQLRSLQQNDSQSTKERKPAGSTEAQTRRGHQKSGQTSVVPLQIKGRLSEACFQEVQDKWPNILHEIKKEKITVHAWLMDGTPVGATDTQVILAFQNQIHRETTERPAHRELIEAVMNRLLGKPLTLVTLMHEEWETLGGGPANTGKETVTSRSDTEQEAERAFIAEAVKIFGADLIEIDKEGDVG